MAASSLRRTESYVELKRTESYIDRTLQHYKAQREQRRRASFHPATVRTLPRTTIRQLTHQLPKHITRPRHRQTSPLAPTPAPLPSRPLFPRSKPEPDLYRKALRTSMKGSPEGQKILSMGPHLAVSMMSATMELERLVDSVASEDIDGDADADADIRDATPWVVLRNPRAQ